MCRGSHTCPVTMAPHQMTTEAGAPTAVPPGSGAGAPADVLVVGTEEWSVAAAARELAAAGHVVHRCCDSLERPFPCNALIPGRGCPLDVAPVRVVLDVRGRPQGQLAQGEFGSICGLRAGLPLVLAGFHAASPLAPFATLVPDAGTVAATVETATA